MDFFDQLRAQVPIVFGRSLDRAMAELQAQSGSLGELLVIDRKTAVWSDLLRWRTDLCKGFCQGLDEVVQGVEPSWPPQSRHTLVPSQDMAALLDIQTYGATTLASTPLASLGLMDNAALREAHQLCLDLLRARAPADVVQRLERLFAPKHWLALAHRLLDDISPDLAILERRMQCLVPALLDELQGLYRLCSDAVKRSMAAAAAAAAVLAQQDAADKASLPALETLCQPEHIPSPTLLKAFLKPANAGMKTPLPEHFRELVQAQLDAVAAGNAAPSAAVSGPLGVGSQLDPALWGEWAKPTFRTIRLLTLKARAETFEQVVALDVVRALVGRLAANPLLLRPVGEALVALEPTLLQLALDEPRFIAQPSHPARRLMDGVLHRAVQHNDVSTPAFEDFYRSVRSAFLELNAWPKAQSGDFLRVVERLTGAWNARDQALQAQQSQRLQALRLAEQRQELTQQIALELSQLPEMARAPDEVVTFLCDEWSAVMAWSRLSAPVAGLDAQTCQRAVASLLWCVQPMALMYEAEAVRATLPELVQTLRRGLVAIGQSDAPVQTLVDALASLCQPPTQTMGETVAEPEPEPLPVLEPAPAFKPELELELEPAPVLESESQSEPEHKTEPEPKPAPEPVEEPEPEPPAQTDDGPAAPEGGDTSVEAVLAGLTQGVWVDLLSQGSRLRAQLVWANPTLTLFMFSSVGGRTHSMSRRSCIKLIQEGRLSLVSAAPDVQLAIRSFTHT